MAKDARGHGSDGRGEKYAESRSEPAIQSHIQNSAAAGALAQGHPKSAPVDTHPAMSDADAIASHPAHSRISNPDPDGVGLRWATRGDK